MGWLLAGYVQKLKHSHILHVCTKGAPWPLAILWAVVCSQGILAIGWLYTKIKTFQDIYSYTMYQSGTWLLSILWTVVCS